MVKLTVQVISQERVSVLYTGLDKEPDGLFEKEKELGTIIPGLLCTRSLSFLYVLRRTSDKFHKKWGVEGD